MSNRPTALYIACTITFAAILIAALLAYYSPDPAPQSITRLLDALIYISIAGALAIFGLIGYKPDRGPPTATPE